MSEQIKELSIEYAKDQIAFIKQKVSILGRNDAEISNLEDLIQKLYKNELTPEEAIRQAEEIERNKQDH